MRVSTGQLYYTGVRQMQNNQNAVSRTFEQISTGQRIQSPSDDPAAMVRVIALQNDNQLIDRYQGNISLLTNSLTEQETHLRNLGDAIGRLETLTLRAGNGSLTEKEHESLSLETEQIFKQIMDIANTRNARGEYVFAGSNTDQQPFSLEPNAPATPTPAAPTPTPAAPTPTPAAPTPTPAAPTPTPATPTPTPAAPTPTPAAPTPTPAAPTPTPAAPTPAPTSAQSPIMTHDLTYPEDGFEFERQIEISSGSFVTQRDSGKDIFIKKENSEQVGILHTAQQLTQVLRNSGQMDSDQFKEELGKITQQLKGAAAQVDTVRAETGARLNLLDATKELHTDTKLHNTTTLSELQDVDFYEALSDLQLQNTVLEAAQRSFAQVSRSSLFDYF